MSAPIPAAALQQTSLDANVASEPLVSTVSIATSRSDAMSLSHPENLREMSAPADKLALSVSDSSASDDGESAEGDLDDEAYDEEGDDALVSTASFQNGDEVIVNSASSVYNGERARIVDIRGEKLMVSVKDEQLVLTLDEVKSLNELYDSKAGNNKNVRASTRVRHQPQAVSPFHSQEKRRNERPKRDASGNTFGPAKSSAAPRSRNNSKAMLGKRVAIVGGRNKGERGRVTKGANGYFTIVLERSATNPSSNTQVMKRSHDLKVIDGSGDFPVPHRRGNQSGWNKKNKSRPYDETEDEMDDEKDEDDFSDREESSKRWSGYSRSRSRSPSPSLSTSQSEMESEPLSDSEASLLMQSDDDNERSSLTSSPHSHSHSQHHSQARGSSGVKSKSVANIEREAAQILMDILQARANSQLKRRYGDKAQNEQQLKRSRTFTYEDGHRASETNESNHAMATEEYGAALRQEVHPNLNVVIGQEDHQFYTPLLSSTSTVSSLHASPAIAPVDESKLYPSSPYTTLSTPLQLTSAQNSPSMKAMSAAANAMHYQKAMTTPTHGARPQFFPATPRSPSSKAVLLPATPNGGMVPQSYARVSGPTLYQIPSPMPQAIRASPNQIPFAVNRQQMTILSTAASTVM